MLDQQRDEDERAAWAGEDRDDQVIPQEQGVRGQAESSEANRRIARDGNKRGVLADAPLD